MPLRHAALYGAPPSCANQRLVEHELIQDLCPVPREAPRREADPPKGSLSTYSFSFKSYCPVQGWTWRGFPAPPQPKAR